jgi:hypothetical protein
MSDVTTRQSSTFRLSDQTRETLDRYKAQMGKSWNEVVEFVVADYDKLQAEHRRTLAKLHETERLLNRMQGRVDGFVQAMSELREVASSGQ